MRKRLNSTEGIRRMGGEGALGLRHPGSTLFGEEIRGNFVSDPGIPTTPQLFFGLGGRALAPSSPDRGAACLYRDRRAPGTLAGEEGLRSAVMVLNEGKLR